MTYKNIVGNNLILNSTHNSDGEDLTYNGYEIFTDSLAKTQLHNPTTINGDLIISSNYHPTSLGLSLSDPSQAMKRLDFYIEEITGNLIMEYNSQIQDLEFTYLKKVGGKIIINGNPMLTTLNFTKLTFANIIQINDNSKSGIITSGHNETAHTAEYIQTINLPDLVNVGKALTITNNEYGTKNLISKILNTNTGSFKNDPATINLQKLQKIGTNAPYTYSNYVTINPYSNPSDQTTLNKVILNMPSSIHNISEKKLDIGEGNRTFQLGMIFKSPNMTQGNSLNTLRHVYYKSTGNNNNKWFGSPTYKFTNLTKEQNSKPIITHKTGSSSDYMALKKARAIGDNTTKYGSPQDLQISFSNSKSTNDNDIKSALGKLRNRGNVVPPKFRNK